MEQEGQRTGVRNNKGANCSCLNTKSLSRTGGQQHPRGNKDSRHSEERLGVGTGGVANEETERMKTILPGRVGRQPKSWITRAAAELRPLCPGACPRWSGLEWEEGECQQEKRPVWRRGRNKSLRKKEKPHCHLSNPGEKNNTCFYNVLSILIHSLHI